MVDQPNARDLGIAELLAPATGSESLDARELIVRALPTAVEQMISMALFADREDVRLRACQFIYEKAVAPAEGEGTEGNPAWMLTDDELTAEFEREMRTFADRASTTSDS
jgi:hypothetical protein